MVFDYLPEEEKVYWLNYLVRMEVFHENMARRAETVDDSTGMHPRRCALLKEANLFYKDFYATAKSALSPLVSKDAMLDAKVLDFDYKGIGTFSFNYLIRDWAVKPAYQEEVITKSIVQKLVDLELDCSAATALFLGCGTGKYAVNLAPNYKQVEAFDASVLMIWCIERLQQLKTWEVLRKVERNCRKIEDTVERVRLEMTTSELDTIASKVHFFVADALKLPFKPNTIQHIHSIYFTDVLPLHQLYDRIIDYLLVEEGVFIHFGPLEYFFNNSQEMLTAEEVRLFFAQKGYRILCDEFLETKHLFNPNSMRHRVYENWFFIAQKPVASKTAALNVDSCLSLNSSINLQKTAVLNQGVPIEYEYSIALDEAAYQLPEVVYEMLLHCNGSTSINRILEFLELQDIAKEEQRQLLFILQELLDAKMIKI